MNLLTAHGAGLLPTTHIQLTEQPIKPLELIEGCEKGIDAQTYVNDHPYMYSGKAKKHTFEVRADALNDVLDWFGMETKLEEIDDNLFSVTVKADDKSFDYWCRRYSDHLRPEEEICTEEEIRLEKEMHPDEDVHSDKETRSDEETVLEYGKLS